MIRNIIRESIYRASQAFYRTVETIALKRKLQKGKVQTERAGRGAGRHFGEGASSEVESSPSHTCNAMMKLLVVLLACALSLANAAGKDKGIAISSVEANSALGLKLLSQARRVEEGQEENNNGDNNNGADITWVAGYSLKFQGCHNIMQWNNEEDGNEDVRIRAKRLVRFRLCPTSSCSETMGVGCKSGYGDYIIDMNTFLAAYYEAKANVDAAACEEYAAANCNCNNGRKLEEGGEEENGEEGGEEEDGGDEDCEYQCFYDAGKFECLDAEDGAVNVENLMECAGVGQARRKLEEGNEGEDNQEGEGEGEEGQEEQQQEEDNGGQEYDYYVGPYCASQGGAIYLGVFTDDSCTESADGVSYYSLTGNELPYEDESVIGAECLSCAEMADGNDDGNGDADYTSEQCELIYSYAGKCESSLPSGTVQNPSTSACSYMEGIKITREDGIIFSGKRKRSPTATAFIVIFAMLFACMAFYVYYLRKRLGTKKDSLL